MRPADSDLPLERALVVVLVDISTTSHSSWRTRHSQINKINSLFPGDQRYNSRTSQILENELPKAKERDEDRERRYQERLSAAREEQKQRLQELSHWLEMDGHTFEGEFAALLRRHDWSVWVTKASGDGGIDIQGSDESGTSVAIQCKRWKKKAGSPEVRDLRGAAYGKFERLIVVCSGGFSKDALAFGEENTIELWGAEQIEIMLERNPLCQKSKVPINIRASPIIL